MTWRRFFLAVGLTAVSATACDDSEGKSSGSAAGGTTSTGSKPSIGSGASPGSGATPGGSGGATGGSHAGSGVECADGCAVLSSPMTASGQSARWQIYLSPADLSNETLTFRIYVKSGGPEGGFQYGFQNGDDLNYSGVYRWHDLSTAVGTWQDISIPLSLSGAGGAGGEGGAAGEADDGADPSAVEILNLWLESGAGSGPWANPSVVYVDSVKSSAGTINYEFTTGVSDLNAQGTNVAGSSLTHTTLDP